MRLTPALAGGASLAVLTLAVMSTAYLQNDIRNRAVTSEPKLTAEKPDAVPPAKLKPIEPLKAPQPLPQLDVATRNSGVVIIDSLKAKREQEVAGATAETSAQVLPSAATPPAGVPMASLSGSRPAAPPAPVVGYSRTLQDRMAAMPRLSPDQIAPQYQDQGRDKFTATDANPVKQVSQEPVSTFSIDVDTASYSFVRGSLTRNLLPQKNAVRVEELINYFPYDYPKPDDKTVPFKTTVNVFQTPWNSGTKLVHVGIKGFELAAESKPRSNLVFLLDTSGSMNAPNKLPLLQNSMKLLLETMRPDDTIAIVTYAGSAGTLLEPTPAKEKTKILNALGNLRAGGSTAGAEGIRQAYELAAQGYDAKAVNRVILATDGDFNVGITNREELKSFIERKRETGVFLSVLGFGMGNYNDALMQALAQNGNGNAAYIDTLNEARKVLVEEASSTLFPIAKDVKIQVEFNPAEVSEYRLIGYETRMLKREDFRNDKVDAGDIGSGHTVTAIYEITPKGSPSQLVGDLRYAPKAAGPATSPAGNGEYAFVKLRYKLPNEDTSKLIEMPVTKAMDAGGADKAPQEARFAASVAAFGQLLTGGRHTGSYSYDDVIALAQGAKGPDAFGYRAEFINLARFAKSAAALESQK
ncbi:MAG: VWA domain-containing protein [Pseudomonadota bacterium]|nr:VWA domain-containing protein [Pseudomonadota bacterium]